MTNTAKQNRKQELAIAALLTQPSVEAAARAVGLGDKTLRRWMRKPEFIAAYNGARREVLTVAIGALHALTTQALAALRRNLDSSAPLPLQLRAALGVFALGLKASELVDVLAKLDAFEARVTALEPQQFGGEAVSPRSWRQPSQIEGPMSTNGTER